MRSITDMLLLVRLMLLLIISIFYNKILILLFLSTQLLVTLIYRICKTPFLHYLVLDHAIHDSHLNLAKFSFE